MKNFLNKIFRGKKQSAHAFVSDTPGKGISRNTAGRMQDQYLERLAMDDLDTAINLAARQLLDGDYEKSIQSYVNIKSIWPEQTGMANSQIGAAYFFLGKYDQAIEYYVSARELGADASMMDDNIWEACETLFKMTGLKDHIHTYLELCPNGQYVKDARRALT